MDQTGDVGRAFNDLPGPMIDVVRRMMLRGWAEWHGKEDWPKRARLTPAGRDVLAAIRQMSVADLSYEKRPVLGYGVSARARKGHSKVDDQSPMNLHAALTLPEVS
ncbi:hypothetical protein [Antarcticirhabdus aurantiaca]|uniref:Uncharacterized protein n=1 Tax=Antarcticirhabdus aurantiaca TaxID=2606717 RepID=A0ACD4NKM3_9HYPH|nr:hypothetical protein [Antarcticirhabdus aurantiaca]WAJ27390.1 hypothetical protein OXU80_21465 [Jeongeuplla avenae]